MTATALVQVPGITAELTAALSDDGWELVAPGSATPLSLLIVAPAVEATGKSLAGIETAMQAVADITTLITQHREQLSAAGGLVLVLVGDAPRRSITEHATEGVVAAALEMTVQLLATDWAPIGVRCLLVVAEHDPAVLATLIRWLASDQSPHLTGQTVDLKAADHATWRPRELG